ncbi:MAG TPA: hypothetical protein P5076_13125, partial [Myxococcota bacterium]|nr:hypothetical protein [Myxococcota bacterium]
WPVVILTDLDKDREGRASALGVEVETLEDEPELDVEQPLADRWLRCWPSPYHSAVTHSPLHERLAENGFQKRAKNRARREALRVLYVCWTRARDRLVLAGAPGVLGKGMAAALELEEPPGEEGLANITWHGARVELQVRRLAAEEGEQREEEPGADFVPAEPRERPRARVLPSEEKEAARAGEPVRLGPPLELRAGTDPIPAGDVLHAFLAADRDGLSDESRRAIARTLLDGHGLASVMPRDLLEAGDRLRRFVAGRWPGAVWRRELPLAMRLEGGSQMFGSCDLALELEAGWVVIDHKGMKVRGEDEQTAAGEKAAGYGGQLRAYARMLQAATGKPVIGAWIHAAALGLAIPVEVQGRKD